ncbi:MAG: cytochrome c peroxidase, partial [Hyphomicrobium sp.]
MKAGALVGVIGAFALFCISVAAPPLDARFPVEPSAAEREALRRAYAGAPATWPRPRLLPDAKFTEMGPLQLHPMPQGKDETLAQLGGDLFNDPRLSASGHVACQSCHNRRLGWGDGLPTSFGHARAEGRRNAPSLFTAGYQSAFFWDGRARSLEEQALGPLADSREMANGEVSDVAQRIGGVASYRERFALVTSRQEVELGDVTAALAAFERTLERPTKFDRFAGGNQKALNDQEVWGLHIFRTKAGCANCHSGVLLSDGGAHNIGLSFFGRKLEDLGRYEATGHAADAGAFRTPSLRHIERTGPYMHNGIFPSLAGVVRFYEGGGGAVRSDKREVGMRGPLFEAARRKSALVQPFRLSAAEREALVAFL